VLPSGVRRIRRGRGRLRRPVANDRSGSICHLLRLRQPTDAVCIVQNQRKYKARTVWAGSVSGAGSAAIRGVMLCAGVYAMGVLIRPTLRGLIARPSPWLALQGISAWLLHRIAR